MNIESIKSFDIEEYIKNLWNKIDDIDKKVFLILFISMNIVYLYNSLFCLFGNHDTDVMFSSIDFFYGFSFVRYSASFLEYIISNKTIIPAFINVILFSFMSLASILLLHLCKIKKNFFNYVLFSFLFLFSPYVYSFLWYRVVCFSILMTIFFVIVCLILIDKMYNCKNNIKKILIFTGCVFILTVFVFLSYPPAIGFIMAMLLYKLLSNCIDDNFSSFLEKIMNLRYEFFMLAISSLITIIIERIMIYLRFSDASSYHIQTATIKEMIIYFPNFIKFSFERLFGLYPFIDVYYRSFLVLLLIFCILGMIVKLKRNNNLLNFSKKVFYLLLSLFLLFVFCNITYLVSKRFITGEEMFFRLEYFTNFVFISVCVLLGLKYSKSFVKSVIQLLLVILIFMGIQINFSIQKTQLIGMRTSIQYLNSVKQKVIDKSYKKQLKYNFITIGVFPQVMFEKNMPYYGFESICTFLLGHNTAWYLQFIPPKMNNIKWDMNTYTFYWDEKLKEYNNTEKFKEWLLTQAKPYPSLDSIYIDENGICVVFDNGALNDIKEQIKQEGEMIDTK